MCSPIKLVLIDQSHSSQIVPKVLVETKITCIFVYHFHSKIIKGMASLVIRLGQFIVTKMHCHNSLVLASVVTVLLLSVSLAQPTLV